MTLCVRIFHVLNLCDSLHPISNILNSLRNNKKRASGRWFKTNELCNPSTIPAIGDILLIMEGWEHYSRGVMMSCANDAQMEARCVGLEDSNSSLLHFHESIIKLNLSVCRMRIAEPVGAKVIVLESRSLKQTGLCGVISGQSQNCYYLCIASLDCSGKRKSYSNDAASIIREEKLKPSIVLESHALNASQGPISAVGCEVVDNLDETSNGERGKECHEVSKTQVGTANTDAKENAATVCRQIKQRKNLPKVGDMGYSKALSAIVAMNTPAGIEAVVVDRGSSISESGLGEPELLYDRLSQHATRGSCCVGRLMIPQSTADEGDAHKFHLLDTATDPNTPHAVRKRRRRESQDNENEGSSAVTSHDDPTVALTVVRLLKRHVVLGLILPVAVSSPSSSLKLESSLHTGALGLDGSVVDKDCSSGGPTASLPSSGAVSARAAAERVSGFAVGAAAKSGQRLCLLYGASFAPFAR